MALLKGVLVLGLVAAVGGSAPWALAAGLEARATTAPRMTVDEAMRTLELIRPGRERRAQDFTLALLDGARFRLSEHRGRLVFVNFWATWCPPCLEELPAMERLWRAHKDRGLVMLAISLDIDPKTVVPFVAKHGFTFRVAVDSTMGVANAYGVRALPATVLVDPAGHLAALALGPRAWDNTAAHALIGELGKR